jgi:hypothetical protein
MNYLCTQGSNGLTRKLHKQVWEDHHGPVPKGYHIHHIDENLFNNNINNLEILESGQHISNHHRNIPINHGQRSGYQRGCRCDACKIGNKKYYMQRYAETKLLKRLTLQNERI